MTWEYELLTMSSGCSTVPQVDVTTTTIDIPTPEARPAVPDPKPILKVAPDWIVLNPRSLPTTENFVYYALTPEQYKVLARGMADIIRWVKEAQWRLDYYRGEVELDGRQGVEGGGDSD